MKKDVDATLILRGYQAATSLLLRHCLSIGTADGRIPVRSASKRRSGPT